MITSPAVSFSRFPKDQLPDQIGENSAMLEKEYFCSLFIKPHNDSIYYSTFQERSKSEDSDLCILANFHRDYPIVRGLPYCLPFPTACLDKHKLNLKLMFQFLLPPFYAFISPKVSCPYFLAEIHTQNVRSK